ncbi:uncharacterized protein METZ01_LOCUS220191, partial [marine metagenome]
MKKAEQAACNSTTHIERIMKTEKRFESELGIFQNSVVTNT